MSNKSLPVVHGISTVVFKVRQDEAIKKIPVREAHWEWRPQRGRRSNVRVYRSFEADNLSVAQLEAAIAAAKRR
jgi:hypothetical protein